MKVLMIAPPSGGIDVYVNVISNKLRDFGYLVDINGSQKGESAYNVETKSWKTAQEVKELVEKVVNRIDFSKYDSVIFHYGKNDIEQYIPVILLENKIKINKPIYFTHYLSWNLFSSYLKDNETEEKVVKATYTFFEKYLFFGTFAKNYMQIQSEKKLDGIVSFLPETHNEEVITQEEARELNKKFYYTEETPIVYMPGFASNYKDYDLLIMSLSKVTQSLRIVLSGRGWIKRLGFDRKVFGLVEVIIVDEYINSKEYKYLTSMSLFGIFPYRQPLDKKEVFQASGTLPNFIYEEKANIVLNEASMPEYVGKGGIILESNTADSLSLAINKLLVKEIRESFEKEATKNRYNFSLEKHAKDIISLIQ